MRNPAKSNRRTLEVLSESQMYRDYERAFTQGTGLPLRLQGPAMLHMVRYAKNQENPFCALVAKSNESCGRTWFVAGPARVERGRSRNPMPRNAQFFRADAEPRSGRLARVISHYE